MKLKAKIYKPSKTAMQSGRVKTRQWVFEYAPMVKNAPDVLMGWNSGGTLQQIRLEFASEAAAIAYAKENGIDYELIEPKQRVIRQRSYASNYAFAKRNAF